MKLRPSIARLIDRLNPFMWLATRSWMRLIPAIPALMVAMVIILPWLWLRGGSNNAVAMRYRKAVNDAISAQDVNTAAMFARKLVQLGHGDDPSISMVSNMLNNSPDMQADEMKRLAPEDRTGHPPAHLWMAKKLLVENPDLEPKEALQRIIHHLSAALSADKNQPEPNALLAKIYLKRGDSDKAISHLQVCASQQPELATLLGGIYLTQGQKKRAMTAFKQGEQNFRELLEDDPLLLRRHLQLIDVLLLQGKHDEAWTEIALATKRNREKPDLDEAKVQANEEVLRNKMIALVVTQAEQELKRRDFSTEDQDELLTRLARVVRRYPRDAAIDRLLVKVLSRQGSAGGRAFKQLHGKVRASDLGQMTLTMMGSHAMGSGSPQLARKYLECALERNANSAMVLNNLAYLLANADEPEIEKALDYADQAVKGTSAEAANLANFRETRGQILAKLQRWDEAREDLEFAEQHIIGSQELHRTLEKIYTDAGEEKLAQKHRMLANFKPMTSN